jgi:hypothetical protein
VLSDAVEIRTPVTTNDFIASVKKYTNCDVAVFNETTYYLSTIESEQGKEIRDKNIIESAKGRENNTFSEFF